MCQLSVQGWWNHSNFQHILGIPTVYILRRLWFANEYLLVVKGQLPDLRYSNFYLQLLLSPSLTSQSLAVTLREHPAFALLKLCLPGMLHIPPLILHLMSPISLLDWGRRRRSWKNSFFSGAISGATFYVMHFTSFGLRFCLHMCLIRTADSLWEAAAAEHRHVPGSVGQYAPFLCSACTIIFITIFGICAGKHHLKGEPLQCT